MNIPALRLHNQQISQARFATPQQLVAWMGGLQGQDYAGAKWSIGLRLSQVTKSDVEQAIDAGHIIRTWPMRGTLFFVAAEDARWMLALTSPKNLSGSLRRRQQLELDDKTLARSHAVFMRELQGGKHLTRDEIYRVLESSGISTAGQRGYHILWNAALHGIICFAATRDKEQTIALLDEWVAPVKTKTRDEALAELVLRYFTSHGPATLQDFIWWSGLNAGEARAGFEAVKSQLISETVDTKIYCMSPDMQEPDGLEKTFVLPGFDEYLLGYKDRSAVLDAHHAEKICPGGNGVFASTIILDGRVAGTWKRSVKKSSMAIVAVPFTELNKQQRLAFNRAAERYATYMGMPATFS